MVGQCHVIYFYFFNGQTTVLQFFDAADYEKRRQFWKLKVFQMATPNFISGPNILRVLKRAQSSRNLQKIYTAERGKYMILKD